ncbi:MAG: hypothetical protein RI957_2155 [Verrucomicrobiota bacterium]|jgi:hypothetical protein
MMRHGWLFFVFVCPMLAFSQIDATSPMPRWSDQDVQRLLDGEDVLSDMLFRPIAESDLTPPVMEGVRLPPVDAEDEIVEKELSEEDLIKYFSRKPERFLTDPQKFLSRQEYRDRLSFLKYHDSDSNVGFYVYLFDGSQQVPEKNQIASVWQQHFADDGPTVLVFYYMGDPSRSEVCASPDLIQSVGKTELERARQSAIHLARVKSQAVDQLDGFCEQMSNRIYWMEKALEAGVVAPPDEKEQDTQVSMAQRLLVDAREWWVRWQWTVVNVTCFMAGAMLLYGWQRARRRYRFPVLDVAHRLEGERGAGVGAVISYANRYVSAQAQREKPPNEWDLL